MREAPVVVEVTRGETVESRHRGLIAAVTSQGEVIAQLGDTDVVTFLRSAAKPFQAIPLVASGAAARFDITPRELAVIVGSHSGQDIHVEAVSSVLAKIGLDASALKCGIHRPFDDATAKRLGADGATALHNNCSGKHVGMLALSRFYHYEWANYDHPDHPVQKQIKTVIAQFAGVEPEAIGMGEDGCGAPTFALSLRRMALMVARLVCPDATAREPSVVDAAARIVQAMLAFPEMVGGTRNRLDTALMKLGAGRLIAKVGAEGVYTVGVRPNERYPRGLGLAVKIEDGDERRVRGLVVTQALKQLEVLSEAELASLGRWRQRVLKNHRGDAVGHLRPAFHLNQGHVGRQVLPSPGT